MIYFRKNNFSNAVISFEEYFKDLVEEDKYNMTSYLLAESYEMLGRRDISVEKYKAARSKYIGERDGEPEKLYFRYSNERLSTPINELDSLMIIAVNKRECGEYDESLAIFNKITANKLPEKFNSDDDKIKYYYELGILYNFRKENDKAIECFNKCVKLNPPAELWVIPHSYFELGKIYYRMNKSESAKEMFDKIGEYKNYDLSSLLDMRLRNFLDK